MSLAHAASQPIVSLKVSGQLNELKLTKTMQKQPVMMKSEQYAININTMVKHFKGR